MIPQWIIISMAVNSETLAHLPSIFLSLDYTVRKSSLFSPIYLLTYRFTLFVSVSSWILILFHEFVSIIFKSFRSNCPGFCKWELILTGPCVLYMCHQFLSTLFFSVILTSTGIISFTERYLTKGIIILVPGVQCNDSMFVCIMKWSP